jgi:hypothetical protein
MPEDVWFPLVFVDFLLSFVILRQFFALLKLLDIYYFVSRVLLRPLGGAIFISVGYVITLFYPLSLCYKKGE